MNFSEVVIRLIEALKEADELGDAEVDIGARVVDAYVLRMSGDELRVTIGMLDALVTNTMIETQLEQSNQN